MKFFRNAPEAALGKLGFSNLYFSEFLVNSSEQNSSNELGWKDTVQMNPGEVTIIRVRYTPQNANPASSWKGTNLYPFNPAAGPGYVWHCHILKHEYHEMMRRQLVTP